MGEFKSTSIYSITFIVCILIINISAFSVLLFTTFGVSVGVTTGTVNMTLSDVKDMLIRIIVFIASFMIINTVLFYFHHLTTTKNRLSNPFKKKKTIGELMKEGN